MAMAQKSCLSCTICSSDLSHVKGVNLGIDLDLKLDKDKDTLSDDLEMFFVLRNVLRVPSSLIQELLGREEGRGPSQWGLGFCDLCLRMVQEAGFLFSRIRRLIKDYDQVTEGVRGRVNVNGDDGDKPTSRKGRGRSFSAKDRLGAENSVLSRIQRYLNDDMDNSKNKGQSFSMVDKAGITNRRSINNQKQSKTQITTNKKVSLNSKSKVHVPESFIKHGNDDQGQIFIETVTSVPDPEEGIDVIHPKIEPDSETEEIPCFDDFCNEGDDPDGEEFVEEQDSKVVQNDDDFDLLKGEGLRRSLRPRKRSRKQDTDSEQESEGNDKEIDEDEDPEDEFAIQGYNSEEADGDADSDFEAGSRSRKRKNDDRQELCPRKKSSQIKPQIKSPQYTTGTRLSRSTPSRPHLTPKEAPVHQCPYCTCTVKGKFSLDAHILRMHQGVTQPFPCDLCPQVFSKLSIVMLHIDLRHSSEIKNCTDPPPAKNASKDPTETKLFNQLFTVKEVEGEYEENFEAIEAQRKKSLRKEKTKSRAMHAHLPFTCPECGFGFSAQWLVNAHVLRCHHGDARSFECDECSKRFPRKVMLYEHRTTCHPEITTPYDGPKNPLALETRIAELERKTKRPQIIPDIPKNTQIFTCTICNVKFTSRITCEVHLKRLHQGPEKKLPCPFPSCDAYFLSVTGQKAHYDQTHKILSALKNQPLCMESGFDPEFAEPFDLETQAVRGLLSPPHEDDDELKDQDDNEIDEDPEVECSEEGDGDSFPRYTTGTGPSLSASTTTKPHLTTKEAPIHKCPYCTSAVRGKFSLDAHILQVHQGVSKPFECDICGQFFSKLATVMLHIDLRHSSEIKNYTDPIPERYALKDPTETKLFNAVFTIEEAETEHEEHFELRESPEKKITKRKSRAINAHLPFKCDECGFGFSAQWMVGAHVLRCHHGDPRSFECDQCPKRFARKVMLLEHRKTLHSKITKPYDGPRTKMEDRIAELKRKTGRAQFIPDIPKIKQIFTCTKCNVKFTSRITCEVHIKRVHQGADQKLACPFPSCNAYFLSVTGQKTHFDQIHVNSPFELSAYKKPLLRCTESECDAEFKRETDLNQHLRSVHSIVNQHMCELCPLLYNDLHSLKNHQLQAHHKELGFKQSPYQCEFCDKILNSTRSLESHKIYAHTKQWKFICPHCSRGFAQEIQRKNHIKLVHLKVRPFTCPHPGCGRRFAQGFNLKSHLRVHTGEKPWNCRYCGKAFSDKSTYNRHMQSHGSQIHICEICGKQFKVWHAYRLHCKTHEKIKARKTNPKRKKQQRDEDNFSGSEEEQEFYYDSNEMPVLTMNTEDSKIY